MDLYCGGNHVPKERFIPNHEYRACDTDFEIRLQQLVAEKLRLFVRWQNLGVFSIPPLRQAKVYVTVPYWWAKYESSCLLYVRTPLSLLTVAGFIKQVEMKGA